MSACALLLGVLAGPALATGPTNTCNVSTTNTGPIHAGDSVRLRFFVNVASAPGPFGGVLFFKEPSVVPLNTVPAPVTPDELGTVDHSTGFFSTSDLGIGTHTIRAAYVPIVLAEGPCTASFQITIVGAKSETAVTSTVNPSKFGQSVTFNATVTRPAGGTPVGSVQFKDGTANLGSPQTIDADGKASISTSLLSVGDHPITAEFTSTDPNTLNSTGTLAGGQTVGSQTVQAADTATTLTPSKNPSQVGDAVTFTASVAAVSPGGGTPDGTVTFKDNGTTIGSGSLSGGSTSFTTSSLSVGTHPITAVYAPANANYTASTSNTVSQVVDKIKTTLTYNGPSSGDFHDPVTLSAKLTRQSDGGAISGEPIKLTMAGEHCEATTGSDGVGSCTITPQEAAGNYTVSSSYEGDATHEASSDSDPFEVTREETTLTYTGDTVIRNGASAVMSGRLVEDDGSPVLTGRPVVFKLGSGASTQTCTGSTDATGVATCTIAVVAQPLGQRPISATFAQDAFYLASSDTAQAIVYAFPTKGAFAIGSGNAANGRSVTFAGSHWSRLNTVAGGTAPNAFDGFVDGFALPLSSKPRCGVSYTATTGNSGKNGGPAKTVPSYMGALVTNRVTKNGSNIPVRVSKIVVVRTTSFSLSGGKGGTGIVVATVPCVS